MDNRKSTTDDNTVAVVEVVTKWNRSSSSEADRCPCCEGPHVIGYSGLLTQPYRGTRVDFRNAANQHTGHIDARAFIHNALRAAPEGAHLRITVEVVTDGGE